MQIKDQIFLVVPHPIFLTQKNLSRKIFVIKINFGGSRIFNCQKPSSFAIWGKYLVKMI